MSQDAWQERFRRVSPRCYQRDHDPSFGVVFQSAKSSTLIDTNGEEWIDLTCGYSATNFGHCHDELLESLTKYASRLGHLTGDPHESRIELAEKLAQLSFPAASDTKVLFSSSGARAVEAAWKAAVSFRPGKIVSLAPSLHGRSIATSQLGATASTLLSSELEQASWVQSADQYPYCKCCPLGLEYPKCQTQCSDSLEAWISEHHQEISAVLVEPVLTARGYVFPPAEYFLRIRQYTERYGVLLIADEIQSGMGRCGGWLLSQEQGWTPDVAVLGKSLGGGILPLAAVVGRGEILDAIPSGAESETASGSPLACAIGCAAVELLQNHKLAERGCEIGEEMRRVSREQAEKNAVECRIDGHAACCVFEFARAGNPTAIADSIKEQAVDSARHFASLCVEAKLKVHLSGPNLTRVVLLPALTITESELETAMDRLSAVIRRFERTGAG
ncbi:MAG: aspartate aminotransferase family protein [Planctomycetota bacterium]